MWTETSTFTYQLSAKLCHTKRSPATRNSRASFWFNRKKIVRKSAPNALNKILWLIVHLLNLYNNDENVKKNKSFDEYQKHLGVILWKEKEMSTSYQLQHYKKKYLRYKEKLDNIWFINICCKNVKLYQTILSRV